MADNLGSSADGGPEKQTVEVSEVQLPLRALRMSAWVFFGVLLAWVPLVIDVLFGDMASSHISFYQALSHGELLLLASVTAAGALGELIITVARDGDSAIKRKMTLAGGLVIEFMVSAMGYAILRFQGEPAAPQEGHIAVWSLTLFGATFATSLCAMLFVESDT